MSGNNINLCRGKEGFYELIEEARSNEHKGNDYNNGTLSPYITNKYESTTHNYEVVENIDLGVFYSVKKEVKK